MTDPTLPPVTIGIPALNEAGNIEVVISSLINGTYPNVVEVLVADGGSTDGTIEILEKLSRDDPRIRTIHNPVQKQSEGLNLIIREAQGELLLRADAHSIYAPDYIEKSVIKLLELNAENVGGAQRFIAQNRIQAGIALASRSLLGSGGARYRDPNFNGAVDTVFLGCYRLSTLRKIGGFRMLSRNYVNEDAEMNLRLNLYKKGSVHISSDIKVWYHPRGSFSSLWKQYFNYGKSRVLTWLKHPMSNQLRGLTPFVFISFLIVLFITDLIFFTQGYVSTIVLVIYLAINLFEAIRITLTRKKSFNDEIWRSDSRPPNKIWRILSVFITLVIMHLAHFTGALNQLIKPNKKS